MSTGDFESGVVTAVNGPHETLDSTKKLDEGVAITEQERFAGAMKRMGKELSEGGFTYSFVGGSWVEMVARSSGVDYSRKHGDIDVIVADTSAVDHLKSKEYKLEVGRPNAAGDKEDFSGLDPNGVQVGLFIKPIDESRLLRIEVGGVQLAGEPLEEVYLKKREMIQAYLGKGLPPRRKDEEDVAVMELPTMVDMKKVDNLIEAEVAQRVSTATAALDNLLLAGGDANFVRILSQSSLPEETKEKVSRIMTESSEDSPEQKRAQIVAVYTEYVRGDVLGRYGLNKPRSTM